MHSKALLLGLVLAVLVCDSLSEKPRKLKKYRKPRPIPVVEENAPIDSEEMEEKKNPEDDASESEEAPVPPPMPKDLCMNKHCGAGRICQITLEGSAECVCIQHCNPETDLRRKVCSNHNETWDSDCHIYQMRCWCDHSDERCRGEAYKHLHVDYYGECKELQDCLESEMLDFPRRMRDWLFNIMRDMADRSELTPHYMQLEREAESNQTRRWTNAAIWKWCDLDGHPHDRTVSRHELFPIRAPLMALEHCIAPFLNNCDADDDHRITLTEWGKCLELPEDDLENKCEEIREEEAARG